MVHWHRLLPRASLLFGLCAVLAVACWSTHRVAYAATPPSGQWRQAQTQIAKLRAQQKAILAKLFALSQQIDQAQGRLQALQAQLAQDAKGLASAQTALGKAQSNYRQEVTAAARLLHQLELLGPTSFVGVLLGAQNWSSFSARLGAMMVTTQVLRGRVDAVHSARTKFQSMVATLQRRQQDLATARSEAQAQVGLLRAARQREQAGLSTLGSKRSFYADQLNQMQTRWAQLIQPFLVTVKQGFAALGSRIPGVPGTTVQFGAGGVQLKIPQSGLNQVLQTDPDLADLQFELQPGQVSLSASDKGIALAGRFVVAGSTTVVFQVEAATFDDVPLNIDLVRAAIGPSGLAIDLSSALQGYSLQSVRATQGGLVVQLAD